MIERISINGFKSIKAQVVTLRPMNVLIGGNGIGKTNFISAFELIRDIYDRNLQNYVLRKGGANGLLYNGSKTTSQMLLGLEFEHNGNRNRFKIALQEAQDRLFVRQIRTSYLYDGKWYDQIHGENMNEATIDKDESGQAFYVGPLLQQFDIYHFHDTGDHSPMKGFADLYDNRKLNRDGSNIAPFLYYIKQKHPNCLQRIERMVTSVSPFFESFVLEPNRLNTNTIRLEWRQKGTSDIVFGAHQLSDGSLRFICLAALLMQPEPPQTILIDEPELGLHPLAINKLCAMLKKASSKSQIIVSTQSTNVVDNFEADDIIVADRQDNASVFKRLDKKELESWLDVYSLGEIWEKNLVGGQPF